MSTITTLYGDVNQSIFEACKDLKLVVLDVDGVLTDGSIYLGNDNEEFKAFNSKDGYGIKALATVGVETAVITGRQSMIVEQRMRSLNVQHIIQGCEHKQSALEQLMRQLELQQSQVASIGDDMPDLGLFAHSAIKVAVQDAHPMVKNIATYVTRLDGGRGAVREFCDLVLQAKGALSQIHGASV